MCILAGKLLLLHSDPRLLHTLQSACRIHGQQLLASRPLAVPGPRRTVLQVADSIRPGAPTAAPPEASLTASLRAPTTVTLADGTTVTLVNPTPRQLPRQQQTGVTWTGLLGVLALTATALMAAAATCFMLYVRPVLQVRIGIRLA